MEKTKANRIVKEISTLSEKDRQYVLRKLTGSASEKKGRNITDLKGLGKEMWANIDIEKYIDEGREW